ncbi:hypothetical protein EVAR_61693_1 [Eumeta japonica]|uniref:Uncharacterized protein n=1 Tax=Eumeta variegata TaxID=151549 RepID=A0A4C1ZQ42_EUMVA|nr:hypothetical protein EVAR_61693_1 [Eumeta japonica]
MLGADSRTRRSPSSKPRGERPSPFECRLQTMMNPRSRMLAAVPGGSVEPPYAAARWRSAVEQYASSTDWWGCGSRTECCRRITRGFALVRGSSRRYGLGLRRTRRPVIDTPLFASAERILVFGHPL